MRILFLAPQPFFQERGTPIAVRLALEVLSAQHDTRIDLLTYHEGVDIPVPNTTLHRIWAPAWLRDIGPGISGKKVLCDILFFFTACRLLWAARKNPYTLIHAVEESVFIALFFKFVFRIPYLYDMDSSLALQLTEKWHLLRPLQPLFNQLERLAVRQSIAVVPVCDALAAVAESYGATNTHVLPDISLLDQGTNATTYNLREEAKLPADNLVLLYIGNLERYQGIDLLLESFARIADRLPHATIVIIGGRPEHIQHYSSRCTALGIASRVTFLGPRPVSSLGSYLQQADILLSPRIKGSNTPMKVYSYLHSGKALVATDLPTHTQVMNDAISFLGAPTPDGFSAALARAVSSPDLRASIGAAARQYAEQRYTFPIFSKRLAEIYTKIGQEMHWAGCTKA
ncbi:MAG: glycosyltransferase [Proteobacteria bacterium]|nr:glycosyltransferase [Pseudomonadota bacterium]